MPVISRFFGIAIYIYWREHAPPHFHAKYQEYEITVNIESGEVNGKMSKRALSLIQEWREKHIDELKENWRRAEQRMSLKYIDPLE